MSGESAAQPRFFRSGEDFRHWLEKNQERVAELWVGFYNQRSGKTGITYKQAVDEALCVGWIDGVRKSVDEGRYTVRFTPRRPRSIWSRVNTTRMKELIELGRVAPPGMAAFSRRDEARSGVYSFERQNATLGPDLERAFKKNARAWSFFQSRPPWYRRTSTWWVISAKKEETRLRRLAQLIEVSARGEPLGPLDRRPRPGGTRR